MGLFSLLDDQSKFPQASDLTFVDKLTADAAKQPDFKRPRGQTLEFVIQHFAGQVRLSNKPPYLPSI